MERNIFKFILLVSLFSLLFYGYLGYLNGGIHLILGDNQSQNGSKPIQNNTVIDKPILLPDQIIIELDKNSTTSNIASYSDQLNDNGIEVINIFNDSSQGYVLNIKKPINLTDDSNVSNGNKTSSEELCSFLKNNSEIKSCNPNFLIPAHSSFVHPSNLPMGINRIDAENITGLVKKGEKYPDVDIAVIDSGVNFHPDLNVYKSLVFNKETKSFIELPYNTSSDDCPDPGHGTHVAGIAAAKGENGGVQGVAPGARVWSLKVLNPVFQVANNQFQIACMGQADQIVKAIDYVADHADEIEILNLSFGFDTSASPNLNFSQIDEAINNAVIKGVTVIVSAGNSNKDASTFSPANNPNVIAVSNVADSDGMCGGIGLATSRGPDDTLANNSNFGAVVDIAAPGVMINSTSKDFKFKLDSGTSMAAPHVAGAAALYKAVHPDASPEDVKDALLSFSSNLFTKCKENGDGYGYFKSDRDKFFEPLLYVKGLFIDTPVGTWDISKNGINGTLEIGPIKDNGWFNGTLGIDHNSSSTIQGKFDRATSKLQFVEKLKSNGQLIENTYFGQIYRQMLEGTMDKYIISGISKSSVEDNSYIVRNISVWNGIKSSLY